MRHLIPGLFVVTSATAVHAQQAEENAVTAAQDAFGVSVGTERIGLYSDRQVRGFNPVTAGNVRIEGTYIDLQGSTNDRLISGNTIRIGLSALDYPFPAPTGIVDYHLRTPGEAQSIRLAARAGSFASAGIDLDAQIPVVDGKLAFGLGASYRRMARGPGQMHRTGDIAMIVRWQPSDNFELIPFFGWSRHLDAVDPTVYVNGFFLPPAISDDYYGQPWAKERRLEKIFGAVTKVAFSDSLALRGGIFRSRLIKFESYSDLFKDTSPEGLADHTVISNPEQSQASTSGEMQLTKVWRSSNFEHSVFVLLRGRRTDSLYGGSSAIDLDQGTIGVETAFPQPAFTFGQRTQDKVSQVTAGIGYQLQWAGVAEISLGLQKTRYSKRVIRPGAEPSSISNSPLLYNGLAAIYLTRRLTVYASYTKGLEENGTAPSVAVNQGEPLPAAITNQREVGLRYAIRPDLRLIAGYFDLRKPYFSLNPQNYFTRLGALRTTGFELSVSGSLANGLEVVAGAAIMNPQVTGEAVDLGLVGPYPVNQARRLVRANIDYRLPSYDALSFDLGVVYNGRIAASVQADPLSGEQLFLPPRATVDLGFRYRFDLLASAAVLRVQLRNVTDAGGWMSTSSGGFRSHGPRRLRVRLTVNF